MNKILMALLITIITINTHAMHVSDHSYVNTLEKQLEHYKQALEQVKNENDPIAILYIEKEIEKTRCTIEKLKKEANEEMNKPATTLVRRIGIVHSYNHNKNAKL